MTEHNYSLDEIKKLRAGITPSGNPVSQDDDQEAARFYTASPQIVDQLLEENERLKIKVTALEAGMKVAKEEIERLKAELETAKEKWRYWEIDMFYPAQLRARAAEDVAKRLKQDLEVRMDKKNIRVPLWIYIEGSVEDLIEKRVAELKAEKKEI